MREEGRVGERWGWRREEREEQGSREEEKAGNVEEEGVRPWREEVAVGRGEARGARLGGEEPR